MAYKFNTLFDAWKAVAEKLSGRKVILRFQQPASKNADGELQCLSDGTALIDINPNLSSSREIWVLAHECFHAKSHFKEMGRIDKRDALRKKPAQEKFNAFRAYDRMELEANTQANKWIEYAEKNWKRYLPGTELECKLEALLEMKDE